MTEYDAGFWEKHYQSLDQSWGTSPNPPLKDTVRKLFSTPGSALELGAGHGGDALWLASQGWDVTPVDVSQTAIDRITAAASNQGLEDRIHPLCLDASRNDLPAGPFELVYGSFFYAPGRTSIWQRAARRIGPGGVLLIIDHGSTAPWSWNQHAHSHPTPHQLAASLNLGTSWVAEILETSTRTATGPGGQTADITDTIVALRKKEA